MTSGEPGSAPPLPPGPPESTASARKRVPFPAARPFGFAQAFGDSVRMWLRMLPGWLPVVLLLGVPCLLIEQALQERQLVEDARVEPSGGDAHANESSRSAELAWKLPILAWYTGSWGPYAFCHLVLDSVTALLLVVAAVRQLEGEGTGRGATVRLALQRMPRALLLMLAIVGVSVVIATVGAGLVGGIRSPSETPHSLLLLCVWLAVCYPLLVWSVALPALVSERLGVRAALARSRFLTHGRRGTLIAIWVVMVAITQGIGTAVEVGLLGEPDVLNDWTEHAHAAYAERMRRGTWLRFVGSALESSLLTVSSAVCYVGLRRAREGPGRAELARVFD